MWYKTITQEWFSNFSSMTKFYLILMELFITFTIQANFVSMELTNQVVIEVSCDIPVLPFILRSSSSHCNFCSTFNTCMETLKPCLNRNFPGHYNPTKISQLNFTKTNCYKNRKSIYTMINILSHWWNAIKRGHTFAKLSLNENSILYTYKQD